ncbi:MAG TPA: hypothetical protein VJX93_03805 [Candidatus Methanomethylophilaceae archaeon]|nr:hypothetical protein [Candidatus Methanomethylophilaceae archaeon]
MSNVGQALAEDLLVSLNMRRNSVKVLLYMAIREYATSDELEKALNIGQPSVSTAIKDISDKGWLNVELIHTETKGRPKHRYSLSKEFSEIVKDMEVMLEDFLKRIDGGLEYLKSL